MALRCHTSTHFYRPPSLSTHFTHRQSISWFLTTLLFLTSRDPQAESGTLICIFSNGWATFKCFTNRDNYLRKADREHSPLTPLPSAGVCLSPFHRHLFALPPASSSSSLESLLSVGFNWRDLRWHKGAARLVRPVTAAERECEHAQASTPSMPVLTEMGFKLTLLKPTVKRGINHVAGVELRTDHCCMRWHINHYYRSC